MAGGALFLKHYQIFDKDLPMMGTAEDWVVSNDFNYLRLLFADDVIKLLRESVDAIE